MEGRTLGSRSSTVSQIPRSPKQLSSTHIHTHTFKHNSCRSFSASEEETWVLPPKRNLRHQRMPPRSCGRKFNLSQTSPRFEISSCYSARTFLPAVPYCYVRFKLRGIYDARAIHFTAMATSNQNTHEEKRDKTGSLAQDHGIQPTRVQYVYHHKMYNFDTSHSRHLRHGTTAGLRPRFHCPHITLPFFSFKTKPMPVVQKTEQRKVVPFPQPQYQKDHSYICTHRSRLAVLVSRSHQGNSLAA